MKIYQKQMFGAGTAMLVLAAAGQAQAEGDWQGSIGLGVFSGPEFLGSSKDDTAAGPVLELVWRDRIFIGSSGIGAYVFDTENFSLSAAVGYDGGREESDSIFLRGLGDIDGGATFNLAMEYELGPVTPYLEVTKYTKGSKGVGATVGVEGMIPLRVLTGRASFADAGDANSPADLGAVLTAGISADWGNDDFNSTYYGVTAAQSAASGLSQHTATSGFHTVNFDLGIQVPVSDRWSLGGAVTYSKLTGDAKNSPFVQKTSGTSVGVFGVYRF